MKKVFLFLTMVLIIIGALILFYPSGEGNTKEDTSFIKSESNLPSSNQQLVDAFSHSSEPHYDHMPITYSITGDDGIASCENTFEGEVYRDVERSIDFISAKTNNAVTFEEVKKNADLTFLCDLERDLTEYDPGPSFIMITLVPQYKPEFLKESVRIYDKGRIFFSITFTTWIKKY